MPGLSCDMWDLLSWPGIKPRSPTLGAESYPLDHQGCPLISLFLLLYSVILSFPSVSTLFLVALYCPNLFWVYLFPVLLSVHKLSPIIVSSSLSRILFFFFASWVSSRYTITSLRFLKLMVKILVTVSCFLIAIFLLVGMICPLITL